MCSSDLLDIAPRTVDLRRQSVLKKMEAATCIQLVRMFGEAGISVEGLHPDRVQGSIPEFSPRKSSDALVGAQ